MPLAELRLKLYKDGDTTNTASGNEFHYDLYPIQDVSTDSRKDAFSIAPPGLSASDNILLGISGMQADISIQATLWDDGSDRSNGTAPSSTVLYTDQSGTDVTYTFVNGTVVTVEEQLQYLEHVMHDESFASQWQLDHLTGAQFQDDPVFVENVDTTRLSQDSPKWKPVTLRLRRGGSVG